MRSLMRLCLGLALSVLGVTPGVDAADANVYTVTYIEVIPPTTEPAVAALRHYLDTTRKGMVSPVAVPLRIEVLQRLDRPNQFVVLAVWADEKAFEAHQAAPLTKGIHSRFALASPTDVRVHHGLSIDPTLASAPAGALYVVTHVDVIPSRKDDGVAALEQLGEESRKHPRHVRFDVVQQTNRPNHFTVIEVWWDRRAFDHHGMTPQTKRFREQLAPMSGSLYDERLYKALD